MLLLGLLLMTVCIVDKSADIPPIFDKAIHKMSINATIAQLLLSL